MTTDNLPGQMDVEDFIAKGLTRPLTDREIAEIHPQAVVDKTETTPLPPVEYHTLTTEEVAEIHNSPHDEMPPTYDHEPDHGPVVDEGKEYPYEKPLAENVEILDANTKHDMPVDLLLRQVYDAELVEVVICGIDKDGHEYLVRSTADMAPAMWHLQRAVYTLNKQYEEMNAGEKT